MVLISVFSTLGIISVVLFLMGKFFDDHDYGIFFYISGFLITLFLGILVATSGLSIVSGTETIQVPTYDINGNVVNTTITEVNEYESVSDTFQLLISLILIMGSLGGVGALLSNLQEKRWKATEDFE